VDSPNNATTPALRDLERRFERLSALAEARVVGRETVSVPAGTFETFVVEPDMKNLGGVFKKSKDASMKIWVTADARCLPVKVKSKVAVGWFTAELTQLP